MEVLARGIRIESYGCGVDIYGDRGKLSALLRALAKAADVTVAEMHFVSVEDGVRGTLLAEEGHCTIFTSTRDKYIAIDSLFTGIKEEKLGQMLKSFKENILCQTITHELIARGVRLGDGDSRACILSEREW